MPTLLIITLILVFVVVYLDRIMVPLWQIACSLAGATCGVLMAFSWLEILKTDDGHLSSHRYWWAWLLCLLITGWLSGLLAREVWRQRLTLWRMVWFESLRHLLGSLILAATLCLILRGTLASVSAESEIGIITVIVVVAADYLCPHPNRLLTRKMSEYAMRWGV